MSQVFISMKPMEVQRNIGYGSEAATSASGCIHQLQNIFEEIDKVVARLDEVWDDDAQRIFMDSFRRKRSSVSLYLGGLKAFLEETNAAVETVKEWDEALKNKLSSI